MDIKEQITNMIIEKEWGFAELLQLNEVSEKMADGLFNTLPPQDIINLIWDWEIEPEKTFGSLYREVAISCLVKQVKKQFQTHFEAAKVSFGETPKPKPVQVKAEKPSSLKTPKGTVKKTSTTKKTSKKTNDGIRAIKGVERL
jgi:hypothetical protein